MADIKKKDISSENSMEKKYCLRRIQLILRYPESYDAGRLQENILLWKAGGVQVILTEENRMECTETTKKMEMLVIADDAELCRFCLENDMPVLGILNQKKDENFDGLPYIASCPEELDLNFLICVWKRFRGLPWNIAETKRCIIRESTEEDLDAFYEIYREPSVTRYMENLYQDQEKEKAHMRDTIWTGYRFYGFGVWTICLKDSGRIIGRAGISMREGCSEPEIGYLIAVPYQNQGFGEEICRAILKYGFEEMDFQAIQLLTRPENKASVRLAGKLGFLYCETVVVEGMLHSRYILEKRNFRFC